MSGRRATAPAAASPREGTMALTMQLSMSEMTTYRWSFEQDVAEYKAAGLSAIGVWRQKLSDFGEDRGIELLAESGLKVSNLLWAGGFTGSDGRTFRESIEDGLDAVRLAAAMQAKCLVVYSGARAGHTYNHAKRLLKDALGELLALAEETDVVLALEPMHAVFASEWTFLNNLDDALAALDVFNSPRLKLVLDTYHLGWDDGLPGRIAQLAPRIGLVQLGDGKTPPDGEHNRVPLGEGTLPLPAILKALQAAGYTGYCDVELMGEEIEAGNYADILRQSMQAFSQLTA
ncbi:MAG: sugar phosphate isomerase/epimerase family protein [Pirellulales bacterium]